MTCIAGIAQNGVVYIGGDSAGVDGFDLVVRADEKVFVNGPYAFGFCGSFRLGQLLHYAFDPPPPRTKDLSRFMVTTFINAVRKCLLDGGLAEKDDNVETAPGKFLVGVRGRLFCVEEDYQVGEPDLPYAAVGCGDQIANGALYVQSKSMKPKDRILQALAAAQRFSGGVRAPFRVVSVP